MRDDGSVVECGVDEVAVLDWRWYLLGLGEWSAAPKMLYRRTSVREVAAKGKLYRTESTRTRPGQSRALVSLSLPSLPLGACARHTDESKHFVTCV